MCQNEMGANKKKASMGVKASYTVFETRTVLEKM